MAGEAALVKVLIPRSLASDLGVRTPLEARGATLAQALRELNGRVPGLARAVLDDQGKVRRNVIVFVNREAVTHLDPEGVALREGDAVHVLPHVAGG
jgi:molybdopterin converting factor small subunit